MGALTVIFSLALLSYTLPFLLLFAGIFVNLLFSRSGKQAEVQGVPGVPLHDRLPS